MSQTKAQLVEGLNINPSAPASALSIDASGNINLDSNTLYVDASTNRVGLGTSSPSHLLTLNAPNANAMTLFVGDTTDHYSSIRGKYGAGNDFAQSEIRFINADNPTGRGALAFATGTNSTTEWLRITYDGKVGIGTTAPDTTLTVSGTGAGIRVQPSNAANATIFLRHGSIGNNSGLEADITGALGLYANGSERARIDSSGRLLVGTSSARANLNNVGQTARLQVEGANSDTNKLLVVSNFNSATDDVGAGLYLARAGSTGVGSIVVVEADNVLGEVVFLGSDGTDFVQAARISAVVDGTPGADDMPGRLVFSTTADGASSPTEQLRISSSGLFTAVSIYNNTTANAANVRIRSDGVFERSTSSVKYKTNVEDLQDFYADAILNIRPIWYRSTCPGDDSSHSWWGFLAEEVAEIDPRLVHWKTFEVSYDENGSAVNTPCEPEPDGVAYDRFVPHLLNLIKRQKEQIETQGTAIAALEARLSALEAQ